MPTVTYFHQIRIADPTPWRVTQESGGYVAINDALNLTTQGETWSELLEMIVDVTDLLFKSLSETNELEGFLTERGLHFSKVDVRREESFNMRPVDARSPVTMAAA